MGRSTPCRTVAAHCRGSGRLLYWFGVMVQVRRWWRAVLVMPVMTLIVSGGAVLPAFPVAAQARGSSETTIRVDLDARTVVVEERLAPTAAQTVAVLLPPEATNVSTDGRVVGNRRDELSQQIDVAVGSEGATVRYELESTDGRSSEGTRVNDAMIGFHLRPNLERATFRIELPRGFVANVGPAFVPRLVGEETLEYTLTEIDNDEIWGLWFVAFRDSGLIGRQVAVGDGQWIEVAGWVDDPEWMDFTARHVEDGVPALRRLIGQPWPASELRLVESVAPAQEGYGGWYDLRASEIAVPDTLDAEVLLHELAHAWFNDTLFEQRWMIEGFAEAYAQAAGEVLDADETPIVEPGTAPLGFDGLNTWRSRFSFEDTWDVEYYGYRASSWVIDRLRDEIGDDGMVAALAPMFDGRHPYAVDADRRATGSNDWRRLLDMVELHGGSSDAEALFRRYVVTPSQERRLDRRREAMTSYARFEAEVADGDRAAVPRGIRYAMSDWNFEAAGRGIDRAIETRQWYDELDRRARSLGMVLPAHLDQLYRDAEVGFRSLDVALADTGQVLDVLEARAGGPSDADRRNFALGRYDRIDRSGPEEAGPALNGASASGSSGRWYLVAIGVLLVLLLATAAAAAKLQADGQPPPRPGDRTPSPPPPSQPPAGVGRPGRTV